MLTPTITRESQPIDTSATFRRILVAIDFTDVSKRALATALELQRRFGSEVCLFHMTELGANDEFLAGVGGQNTKESGGDLVDRATGRLQRFVENVFPGSGSLLTYRAKVETDLARAIDSAATAFGATLVVLGTSTKTSILRTASEKVVQLLDCPVLLVREPEAPSPAE